MRRPLLLGLLLAAAFLAATPARGQETGGAAPSAGSLKALDPQSFVALAASLAMFEIEAGGHAMQRSDKPELVALARDTVGLQSQILERLRPAAQERGLTLPSAMSLEHRAVLDGLAPLDGVELARRYAQAQTQAMDQALALYGAAAGQDEDPELKTLAADLLPRLQQQAQVARSAQEAVLP
jgi:putative membrane protein